MPWEKVEKKYVFDGSGGKESLADLFGGRSQLIVYHFMFGPGWKEGCPSCSFLADTFDGVALHLAHRDTTLLAVSRATLPEIEAFKQRMGWRFKWVSSFANDFNYDYHVSFTKDEVAKGKISYNYDMTEFPSEEAPGASVFYKNKDGEVFHTYSSDEDSLVFSMSWVRHHDRYDDNYAVDAEQTYVAPAKTETSCCSGAEHK